MPRMRSVRVDEHEVAAVRDVRDAARAIAALALHRGHERALDEVADAVVRPGDEAPALGVGGVALRVLGQALGRVVLGIDGERSELDRIADVERLLLDPPHLRGRDRTHRVAARVNRKLTIVGWPRSASSVNGCAALVGELELGQAAEVIEVRRVAAAHERRDEDAGHDGEHEHREHAEQDPATGD